MMKTGQKCTGGEEKAKATKADTTYV